MTDAYEIIISQSESQTETDAVSQSKQMVTQTAEKSEVAIDIFDTAVYGGDGNQDYGIGVNLAISNDVTNETIDAFLELLEQEQPVETIEEIHYERAE